jgi:PII-like signaling protein
MPAFKPARLVRVLLSEADQFGGKPAYEAIVEKCRELGIAGAMVLRGVEGFGESTEMHRAHLLVSDRPIVVTIVDSEENVARLLRALEDMLETGLIATSIVQAARIQK